MPVPLIQKREVLQYDEMSIDQVVLDDEMNTIGRLRHNDIVIVVDSSMGRFIKVMMPSGKIGWTYYLPHRLIRPENSMRPISEVL